jgi:hypothetical protein
MDEDYRGRDISYNGPRDLRQVRGHQHGTVIGMIFELER